MEIRHVYCCSRVNHEVISGHGRLAGDGEPPPPYEDHLEHSSSQRDETRSGSRSGGRRGRRQRRRRNDSRDREEAEAEAARALRQQQLEEEEEQREMELLMESNNNGDINGNSELINHNIVLAEAQAARLEASQADEVAQALMDVMSRNPDEPQNDQQAAAEEEELEGAVGGVIIGGGAVEEDDSGSKGDNQQ